MTPGELVKKCEITRIGPENIFIKLSQFVTAVIPMNHATDTVLKRKEGQPPKLPSKIVEGGFINVKVWQILPHLSSVKCTAKKSFVKCAGDSEDLLTRFEDAKENQILTGVVEKTIENTGVKVQFFGGLHGLI